MVDITTKGYKREFLNPKKGIASIEYEFTKWTPIEIGATFTITDCCRRVNLEFNTSSAKELKERKYKLDTLIKHLQEFREKVFNDE